ncbi:MAG: GNAT family N-acetyltransferase [Trueperaceae bacterium]
MAFRDMVFREVTQNDSALLARIIAEAFEEYRGKLEPPSSSLDKTSEAVRKELETFKAILAYTLREEAVACVFYVPREDSMYLAHLAVLPAYRGLGIAKNLMQYVEQKALEQQCPLVRLEVRLVLEKTRQFYEHQGYVLYDTRTALGYTQPTHGLLEKVLGSKLSTRQS